MNPRIVLILCTALFACHDNAKEAARKADEARIEADYRAHEEMRVNDQKARNEKIASDRARNEHTIAVAQEKTDARSKVEERLNSLDKYIAELTRGTKASKVSDDQRSLEIYREALQDDLIAIVRASDPDWPSVKARVENDVDAAKKRIAEISLSKTKA